MFIHRKWRVCRKKIKRSKKIVSENFAWIKCNSYICEQHVENGLEKVINRGEVLFSDNDLREDIN